LVNNFKPGTYYEFDSYMVPLENLAEGTFRLLEVDRRLPVPVNTPLTFLITSVDVIHS
jgi:cytochrome c oxidase subunit 2